MCIALMQVVVLKYVVKFALMLRLIRFLLRIVYFATYAHAYELSPHVGRFLL